MFNRPGSATSSHASLPSPSAREAESGRPSAAAMNDGTACGGSDCPSAPGADPSEFRALNNDDSGVDSDTRMTIRPPSIAAAQLVRDDAQCGMGRDGVFQSGGKQLARRVTANHGSTEHSPCNSGLSSSFTQALFFLLFPVAVCMFVWAVLFIFLPS